MLRKLPCFIARSRLHNQFLAVVPRRCMSRAYEAQAEALRERPPPPTVIDPPLDPTSTEEGLEAMSRRNGQEDKEMQLEGPLADFAVLGVRKSVRVALHEAFPNIRTPTACQTEFIPAVLSNKDVILKDWTGTGKSFGLILALLSKTRATRPHLPYKARIALAKRPITSLIIVPHRDLAYQLLHWIRMLCPHNHEDSLDSIAQVCARGNASSPLSVQLTKLRTQAPHILIGTPQALVQILEKDKSALQISTLETVVVDEVDYLLPFPPPGAPKKMKWKWDAHPPPTLSLLNALFEDRSKLRRQENSMSWRWPLQVVFSSATLRHHLRRFFFSETIWMDRYSEVIKIDFEKDGKPNRAGEVRHFALVVDEEGAVRNVKFYEGEGAPEKAEHKNHPSVRKSLNAPQSIKPAILEAVATTFALDVPKSALLVLPAAAPVHTVVAELRGLGVDAQSLGLQDEERGKQELMRSTLKKFSPRPKKRPDIDEGEMEEPSLLVTTAASIRGLDLPELSHVFVVGIPESEVEYSHVAGRVGRFGREGRVIVFLEQAGEAKVTGLYKSLGLSLSEFEHVGV